MRVKKDSSVAPSLIVVDLQKSKKNGKKDKDMNNMNDKEMNGKKDKNGNKDKSSDIKPPTPSNNSKNDKNDKNDNNKDLQQKIKSQEKKLVRIKNLFNKLNSLIQD